MPNFQPKGIQLVNNDRVISIDFSTPFQYNARVFDEYSVYHVSGNIQDDTETTCNCSDFKFYNDCAHIWATHIKLALFFKERESQHGLFNEQNSKDVLNSLQYITKENVLGNIANDIKIELDIILRLGNQFLDDAALISGKIGISKLYVIKRFDNLLLSYKMQDNYQLGKEQFIDWQNVVLSHEQQDLFELLDEALLYEVPNYTGEPAKYLSIHPLILPKLLHLAQQVDWITINFRMSNKDIPIQISDHTQPLSIQIGQSNNHQLLVKVTPTKRHYFYTFKALLHDKQLYLFNAQQHKLYMQLLEHIDNYDQLVITKDYQHQFLSYALPLWKQIATVKVDKKVLDTIQQKNGETTLQLEQVNQKIEATLNSNHSGIVDVEKELFVNYHLNANGFKQIEDKYVLDASNKQALHHFLSSGVKQLEQIIPLQHSDNFGIDNTLDEPIILAKQNQSLLDISFNINGISQKDVENILKMVSIKEPLYRLENGLYVDLDDQKFKPLHNILSAIRGQSKFEHNTLQVNRLQALSISEQTNSVQFDANINQMITHLKSPETFSVTLPKHLNAQLKDYQVLGFKWLKMLAYHQLGGILADEMGLGKTLQSIAYIVSEIEEQKAFKTFLILSPASLVLNWVHEWQRFAPHISVQAVLGDKQTRQQQLKQSNVQVFVTSYQSYRQDDTLYHNKDWHTIILDESQYIKNYSTKIHQSLRQLNGSVMFALSGTPIENKKEDLWSVFSIILPGLYPNIRAFKQLPNDVVSKMGRPFILRRLKQDVLTELPEKLEKIHYNDLTQEQKALYVGYLQQMQQQISQLSDEQMTKNRIDILAGLTRLRQICNHPSLFVDNYNGSSGKLEQCLDLVKRTVESGHRILLFSQFSTMLALLEQQLHDIGIDTFTLTGQTPTTKRLDLVNAFNNGEKDVFLISLKAGGTGLNLTSADTIILYDLWWNPAVEEQATARAHRIGQDNIVHVYRLVSQGTIEEKMLALQEKKKALFDDMIFSEQTQTINRTQLTNDDIKEILGII